MPELTTYQSELFVGIRNETQTINDQLEKNKLYQLVTKHANSNSPMEQGMFIIGATYNKGNDIYHEISEKTQFPAVNVSVDNELATTSFTNQRYQGQNVTIETGGNTLTGTLEFHVRDDDDTYKELLSKFFRNLNVSADGQTVTNDDLNNELVFVLRLLLNKDAAGQLTHLIAGITFTSLPSAFSFAEPAVQSRTLSWSQASGTISNTVTQEI